MSHANDQIAAFLPPPIERTLRLALPAEGHTFSAVAVQRRGNRPVLIWVDSVEVAPTDWISGWVYWPQWMREGLLEDGPIIPGTYGDGPIYVTDRGLEYAVD